MDTLPRTLSHAGLSFIKGWEKFSATAYPDEGGRPTIGFGHLVRARESFPNPISEAEGLQLLREDVHTVELGLSGLLHTVSLTQSRFDALCSFAYNCGLGAFYISHLCQLVKAQKWGDAAREFLRWDHVGRKESAGLLNRREQEASMFEGLPYRSAS